MKNCVLRRMTNTRIGKNIPSGKHSRESSSLELSVRFMRCLSVLSLASTMLLSACGGGSQSSDPPSGSLAGNWQFSLTNPDTSGNYTGAYGVQGGFLLVNNGKVTGQVVYSLSGISLANGGWDICDSGSAAVSGTVSGQTVNLTVASASQTFLFQGMLGSNGDIHGTFTTPGGAAA